MTNDTALTASTTIAIRRINQSPCKLTSLSHPAYLIHSDDKVNLRPRDQQVGSHSTNKLKGGS
jgi:hypothetical protein